MGAIADEIKRRREGEIRAALPPLPDIRGPQRVAGRVLASSPVQNIASFLNRLVFPQTSVELEFLPELKEWQEATGGGWSRKGVGMSQPLSLGTMSPTVSPMLGMFTGVKAAVEGTPGEPFARLFKALGRGVTGKEEAFTGDVATELFGPPESRGEAVLRGGIHLAHDFLRDPANLFDFFNLTEAGRFARPMGELAETIGGQAAKGQRALVSFGRKPIIYGKPVMEPLSKVAGAARKGQLGEWFTRGGTHAGLRKAVLEHLHEAEVFKGEARVAGRRVDVAVADMVKQFGVPEDEVRRVVNEVLERGEVAGTPITRARQKLEHLQMLDMDKAPGKVPEPPAVIVPEPKPRPLHPYEGIKPTGPSPDLPVDAGRRLGLTNEQLEARLARLTGPIPEAVGDFDATRSLPGRKYKPAPKPPLPKPLTASQEVAQGIRERAVGSGKKWTRRKPRVRDDIPELGELFVQERKVSELERVPLKLKREVIEQYGEEFYDRGVRIAEDLAAGYSGELTAQQLRNLPISDLREMGYGGPRVFTDDGLTVLRKTSARIKRGFKRWSLTHSSMRERLLTKGHSLDEVNNICRDPQVGVNHFIPELNDLGEIVTVPKMLLDDPAALRSSYGMRVARVKATADLVEDIKRLPGAMHVEDIPLQNRMSELAGMVEVDLPAMTKGGGNPLEGWMFDADLGREIQRQLPEIIDPAFPQRFTQFWDAGTNWWKAWTLAPFPAYHTRNVVGNMVNSFHAGVRDPLVFHDAARIEMAMWQPDSKFGRWFKQNAERSLGAIDHRVLDDIGRKYGFGDFAALQGATETRGIMGFGWFGSEVAHGGKDYMRFAELPGMGRLEGKALGRWQPGRYMGRESVPVRSGMTVGTILENNARLGVFLDATRKNAALGVPIANAMDDAAWTVKKYLFDYSDAGLTTFERTTIKRFVPFYTWTRNNLPLQLEELVKHPHRYGMLEKSRQAVETAAMPEGDPRYLPEWMTEAYSWATGKKHYTPMERWLPQAEIGRFTKSPLDAAREVAAMGHPLITQAAEQVIGKNLFTGRDLDSEYWRDVVGIKMSPRLANLLMMSRPVSEATWMAKPSEEMPGVAKALRLGVGKTYPYDEKEAKQRTLKRLIKEIGEATTRAKYAEDEADKKRHIRTRQQLVEKYKALTE